MDSGICFGVGRFLSSNYYEYEFIVVESKEQNSYNQW